MDPSWKTDISSLSILSHLSFVLPITFPAPHTLVHFVLSLYHSVGAEGGLMRERCSKKGVGGGKMGRC